MNIESKMEQLMSEKEKLSSGKAYERLAKLFDDGTFTELDAFAKSADGYAEVVAAHGFVRGLGVYVCAQNSDIAGGAMSKAQAAKIRKLYDLALKTGEPVVVMYDSIGGRLNEGAELLASYGDVLKYSNNLSGVVPQIAVVLGKCFGTQALIASSADILIMSEQGALSLHTGGNEASAEENAKHGVSHITAKDEDEAIEQVKSLVELLPSNNLASACIAYESVEAQGTPSLNCSAAEAAFAVADADSLVELQAAYGKGIRTALATVNGTTVGMVATDDRALDGKSCAKAARFIRFCDAFSLPVISFIDAERFECIKGAAKLTAAYAEATSAKISIVTGDAFGAVYIAAAGTGAACDMTFAYPGASVSALTPETEAVIMLGDDYGGKLKGSKDPKADRAKVVADYKDGNMTVFRAAAEGYVDDIIAPEDTRAKLAAALDMLSNKRVSTLPKKHGV